MDLDLCGEQVRQSYNKAMEAFGGPRIVEVVNQP